VFAFAKAAERIALENVLGISETSTFFDEKREYTDAPKAH